MSVMTISRDNKRRARHSGVIALGKMIRFVARLRGGGAALPGLVVDKLSPTFVPDALAQLPHGVIVVSGTNGKTTTTRLITALLAGQGLNVFTNRTGSNFVRGVAAALLGEMKLNGKLDADVAVIELDEAHAVHFIERVRPRHTVLLNVMRDQLDRFGEIDGTASLLSRVAQATTQTVILNREDARVAAIDAQIDHPPMVKYFGLSQDLRARFPQDDDLHGRLTPNSTELPYADVVLSGVDGDRARFVVNNCESSTTLKVTGGYNFFNAAAAIAAARVVVPDASVTQLLNTLSTVTPAFGRGEVITVDGEQIELVLVKNPGGFRLGLDSLDPSERVTMVAVNDDYSDGRDVSWLWDVDFTSLKNNPVVVSGRRAHDVALRLYYDDARTEWVEPDLARALTALLATKPGVSKRIYCTYTAMLALRKLLSRRATVETVS